MNWARTTVLTEGTDVEDNFPWHLDHSTENRLGVVVSSRGFQGFGNALPRWQRRATSLCTSWCDPHPKCYQEFLVSEIVRDEWECVGWGASEIGTNKFDELQPGSGSIKVRHSGCFRFARGGAVIVGTEERFQTRRKQKTRGSNLG